MCVSMKLNGEDPGRTRFHRRRKIVMICGSIVLGVTPALAATHIVSWDISAEVTSVVLAVSLGTLWIPEFFTRR
jgi:hypothetical protein